MQSIAEYTRRSSKSTHDASRNTERLARLIERLRASVEVFKLRDNQQYVVPNTYTTIPLEEDESPRTVTGAFSKVRIHSQPLRLPNENASQNWPALPATNGPNDINGTGQMRALKRQSPPQE
jgi:hypothetical protein